MTKFFRRSAVLATLSAVYFSTPWAGQAASPGADLFPDPIVAKGKGFTIKESKVEEAFIMYKSSVAANGQTVPEAQREMIESNLLQRLIITEVLMGRSNADDKKKGQESTDKFLEQTKKRFPSETVFNAQIKATGMSMDQFRTRALEQNVCELVLDRELKSKITVADDKLKKFYDENPKDFERPERARVSHILILTQDPTDRSPLPAAKKKEKEKAIRDIKARADKGEDFAKLAKQYSEDPGSKDAGGEYTFARAKDDPQHAMVPEFEAAAFSLKLNQISDVVETQYGYHIIKLLEKKPAEKEAFAKVTNNIKEYLTGQEFEKQLPDYMVKIKKEAGVELIASKAKAK